MSIQQLPVELLRKILDELFLINEAYRWETPRLSYLRWMTVCKLWHALMLELLYRSVQLEDLEQLRLFSSSIRIHRHRARAMETFKLRDLKRSRKNSAAFTRIPFAHLTNLELVDIHFQKIAPRFAISAATVTKLVCNDVTFVSNDSLKRFMKGFTGLRDLSIEGIQMEEEYICNMLLLVGSKLESFTIISSVSNLDSIFALIPNVKRLKLVVPTKGAWMMLSPYILPQSCEDLHLESGHLPFVMNMMALLSERTFLPAMKVFPRIAWYRQRGDHATVSQSLACTVLKNGAKVALAERGMLWTERDSDFTMLQGTSNCRNGPKLLT